MNQVSVIEKNIEGISVFYVKVPFSLNTHVGFFSLSGSYAENEKNQGVAHYLEHLFFKGTKNRDLFRIADDAALLGAEQNAYTSEFVTHYYLNVPKVNTDGALDLLCDMMFNPLFPEAEVEKERSVIQEERKMYEDNPRNFFFEEAQGKVLNFQVGHRIIGTKETINSIKRDDLVNYHSTMYGLNTTIMVIVGDDKPEDIFNLCHKHFKKHTFKSNKMSPMQADLFKDRKTKISYSFNRPNIQQTYIMGFFPGLGLGHANRIDMTCTLDALGGGMYSILFKELREKLGLCYEVWAFSTLNNADCASCAVYSQTDPSKAEIAKEKIIEVVTDIRNRGFRKENFECAKASRLGEFCREASSISTLANIIGRRKLLGIQTDFESEYNKILNLNLEAVNRYAMENLPNFGDFSWVQMNPEGE